MHVRAGMKSDHSGQKYRSEQDSCDDPHERLLTSFRGFTLQQVASGYSGDSTGDDGGVHPLATSPGSDFLGDGGDDQHQMRVPGAQLVRYVNGQGRVVVCPTPTTPGQQTRVVR